MAVKTATNYYNNAIVGIPQVGADFNVHETNANPKLPVGQRFTRSDGAVFVYGQFSSATNAGVLVSSDLSSSVPVTGTNVIIQTQSATAIAAEAIKPCAAGSHYVEAYLTAGVDQFAGGYLVCDNGGTARSGGTNDGLTYRIRGNTAAASGGGTKCMINLYEPLEYEMYTETNIGIVASPYADLIPAEPGVDASVVGVTCSSVPNNYYAWVQLKGISAVQTADTYPPTVGQMVGLDTATGGAITACYFETSANLFGAPFVGFAVLTGSNGTHSAIALNIC